MSRLKHRRRATGFTLIELMLVVGIVGVLAALAIYGVRKYLLSAKTTEARNGVGQMAKDAKAAFERESILSTVMSSGGKTLVVNNFCSDAAHAVPQEIGKVQNSKYQSTPSEWSEGNSSTAGFVCLRFSVSDPQYYMYDYKGSAGESGTFLAVAYGDLNADGVTSTFALSGKAKGGVVFVSPNFDETNPDD